MAIRIPRSEFEHLAPQQPGKLRIRADHGDCSGESQNLLIERTDYGVSCWCFRCGGRGYYFLDPRYRPIARHGEGTERAFTRSESGIVLPADAQPSSEDSPFPAQVQGWLSKKGGLLSPVIAHYGFLWSNQEQALYIPVQQETSAFGPVLRGYIKRTFNPKGYKTLRTGQEALWGLYRGGVGRGVQGRGVERLTEAPVASESICLVEDVVSAIRVAQTGMDALAMCGTNLPAEAASFILTEGYKRAIVFLDGDNPTVQAKARTAANKLSWLPTKIVETGSDPKTYPKQELREMLFGEG